MISVEKFVEYFPENPKVFLELGAREAHDSLYFKELYPQARVVAVEANELVWKENYTDKIEYFNAGVFNETTRLKFHLNERKLGISSFRDRGAKYGSQVVYIDTITADAFCRRHNIDEIDVLKLDVEGCSYEVLESFGDKLKNIKVMHIETETEKYFKGQFLEEKVFNFLLDNGFELLEHSQCADLNQYDSIWRKV